MQRTQELIEKLQLTPHPEGGFYKETHRSNQKVTSPIHSQERNALTDIYFLLTQGKCSKFHRVHHDEIWYWHEGENLSLFLYDPQNKTFEEKLLGPAGDYKITVPGGVWQGALCLGAYTLVSCCVAPGFDFEDFLMADLPPELIEFLTKKDLPELLP